LFSVVEKPQEHCFLWIERRREARRRQREDSNGDGSAPASKVARVDEDEQLGAVPVRRVPGEEVVAGQAADGSPASVAKEKEGDVVAGEEEKNGHGAEEVEEVEDLIAPGSCDLAFDVDDYL
jgi:hypothetical protein